MFFIMIMDTGKIIRDENILDNMVFYTLNKTCLR